jgi:hypothetical protein
MRNWPFHGKLDWDFFAVRNKKVSRLLIFILMLVVTVLQKCMYGGRAQMGGLKSVLGSQIWISLDPDLLW